MDVTTEIQDSNNQEIIKIKETLLKELEEKNNIIENLQKQVVAIKVSMQNITQLYKVTKKKYAYEKKCLKRLQEYHFKSHSAISTKL